MKTEKTTTQPKFKKILLDADRSKIRMLKKRREEKKELLEDLEKEAHNLIGEILPKDYEAFFNNPLEYVSDTIVKDNPTGLNIKFEKLLYILELDLTNFKTILNKMKKIDDVELIYKDWKVISKVDEERYKTYTSNLKENEVYNDVMNFINSFKKVLSHKSTINVDKYTNSLKNHNKVLIAHLPNEQGEFEYKPNPHYVKQYDSVHIS